MNLPPHRPPPDAVEDARVLAEFPHEASAGRPKAGQLRQHSPAEDGPDGKNPAGSADWRGNREAPTGGQVLGFPPRRASWRFMRGHPLHWISLGFGSGLSPIAPGTAGTLCAWILFSAIDPWLAPWGPAGWALVLALGLALGWWACTRTAQALGSADPGAIVWDEILAFWAILWLVGPRGATWQMAAFLLFRFFDAAKPGPVAWADGIFKGQPGQRPGWAQGWGILFDDLVAAGCTLLVLAVWLRGWG
jgi:phosphatidylglycerophosphatase A